MQEEERHERHGGSVQTMDVDLGTLATSIIINATKNNSSTAKSGLVRCYNVAKVGHIA